MGAFNPSKLANPNQNIGHRSQQKQRTTTTKNSNQTAVAISKR